MCQCHFHYSMYETMLAKLPYNKCRADASGMVCNYRRLTPEMIKAHHINAQNPQQLTHYRVYIHTGPQECAIYTLNLSLTYCTLNCYGNHTVLYICSIVHYHVLFSIICIYSTLTFSTLFSIYVLHTVLIHLLHNSTLFFSIHVLHTVLFHRSTPHHLLYTIYPVIP